MKRLSRFLAMGLAVLLILGSLSTPFASADTLTEPPPAEEEIPGQTQAPSASTEPTEATEPQSAEPELPEEMPEQISAGEYAFFADSADQALEIANSIGATFISYQYGIGTLRYAAPAQRTRSVPPENVTLYPEQEYTVQVQDADGSLDQWHLPILEAEGAWEKATGEGVLVAVIDSGIDGDHEDLAEAIYAAETTIPENYYGPGGMFLPEYRGPHDHQGHGTHVAGIIASGKNGFGITGIAPDCSILSIKALEKSGTQGRGKSSWVAAAVNLAVEKGADIINMSLGGSLVKDELLKIAVGNALDAGVIVVCAAGNVTSPVVMYPGAYEGVIAVSALRQQGDFVTFASSYSNSGDWIDYSAPGSAILSTVPDGYGTKSGTSMACPVISGAFALLLSQDPQLTAEQAERILRQTARDLGQTGRDDKYGYGMPDLQAMTALLDDRLALHVPQARIPSGSTLIQGAAIAISTQTLHGQVVYTLDGTEPTAESPVWPAGGMTFPQETEEVRITARTLRNDGELSQLAEFTYTFVPALTVLTEDTVSVTGVIPGYAPYLDPVLRLPCRRYQIQVEPGKELVITPGDGGTEAKCYLFDSPDADAEQWKLSKKAGKLIWKNKAKEAVSVILSLVQPEAAEGAETAYAFHVTQRDAAADPPAQTQPAEPEVTVPETTVPETVAAEVTEPETTMPAQTTPQEDAQVPYPEFEEDWLYAMEETEPTSPTAPADEEGDPKPMDSIQLQSILACVVVMLFGIGLTLLGYFTGRKSFLLLRDGQPAVGTVVRIVPDAERRTYRYQVAYTTGKGEKIVSFWKVYPHRGFARRHPEGSKLKIKYLPEAPKEFMVADHPVAIVSSMLVLIVGIGVMLLGIVIGFVLF